MITQMFNIKEMVEKKKDFYKIWYNQLKTIREEF